MTTPAALGYALHAGRGRAARVAGRLALAVASVEALVGLGLALTWVRGLFA